MTYTVKWAVACYLEVERIAAAAGDPAAVRAAILRIAYTLRRTPHDMGESRDPGERLWYDDDLVVRYKVDDEQLLVTIVAVGPARRG
jgi:hypothetical protein